MIHDSFELMPYGSFWVKPGTITYEVLPIVRTDGFSLEDSKALTELLREQAISCIENHKKSKIKRDSNNNSSNNNSSNNNSNNNSNNSNNNNNNSNNYNSS